MCFCTAGETTPTFFSICAEKNWSILLKGERNTYRREVLLYTVIKNERRKFQVDA
jgi:hypothetical protein